MLKGLLVVMLCSAMVWAGDGHDHQGKKRDGFSTLDPDVKELLREEMRLLKGGLQEIGANLPEGNWEAVAQTAEKMRDSFILRKKITPEQGKKLHAALSPAFIEKDVAFHETANKLVHAAHREDPELTSFYLGRMVERCMGCHAVHAKERFPKLNPESENDEHHHH